MKKISVLLLAIFSITAINSCKKGCDNTAKLHIANKVPEVVVITINGVTGDPVQPDDAFSQTVSAGVSVAYSAHGQSSGNSWSDVITLSDCDDQFINLTY